MPSKGKVYVIDDDEAMRDSLNFLLQSAGFDVTLFENALNFLDALPARSISWKSRSRTIGSSR